MYVNDDDHRLVRTRGTPATEFSIKPTASVLKTCWSFKKDVKLYGTNSGKSFGINKSAKKRTQIYAKLSAKTCYMRAINAQTMPRERALAAGHGEALAGGERKVGWQQKDVKIYGTNSVKSFSVNKSGKKTNSNLPEIKRKNVLKTCKNAKTNQK
jgi:hypothetical protein